MAATVYDYKSGDELGIVNDAVYVKYLEEIAGSHTGVVEGLDFGFPGVTVYLKGDVLEDRAKRDAEVVELVKAALEMADGVTYVDVGCREIEVEASEELRSVLKELAEKLGVE